MAAAEGALQSSSSCNVQQRHIDSHASEAANQLLQMTTPVPEACDPDEVSDASPSSSTTMQEIFEALVMCDFTPRRPNELPMARWASYKELARLFEKYADVRRIGPGNLKQMIIAW